MKRGKSIILLLLAAALCLFAAVGCAATLTLPGNLKTIEAEAFYGDTSLDEVVLPEGLERIESRAFAGSSVSLVHLPSSVTYIADDILEGCKDITATAPRGTYAYEWAQNKGILQLEATSIDNFSYSINYGKVVIEAYIGNEKDVVIPRKIGGYPVTKIAQYAFDGCSDVTSIVIPNSVTSIGEYAFWHCSSLTSITIPDSVISISQGVFSECSSISSIVIPKSVTSIGSAAFDLCSNLTDIIILGPISNIGDWTFNSCYNLKSIIIPDSVKSIGVGAFTGTGLSKVVIPTSVTSIGMFAFADCSKLTRAYIPDTVTNIDQSAFSYCSNLTIYGKAGSYVANYAVQNSIPFIVGNPYSTISDFTLNSILTEITVPVGSTLTFGGTVHAGDDAQLVAVQASVFDASDPTKGVKVARAENINAETFDLSSFADIVVGNTYSDDNQTLTMEAGKSYDVMLYATNTYGCGFASIPTIRVNVTEAVDEEHEHEPSTTEAATYLFHVFETESGNNLSHDITAIVWEVPCAICGEVFQYKDTTGYEGDYVPRTEEHTYSEDGYCTECGYVCVHEFEDTGEAKKYTGVWEDCEDGTHKRISIMEYFECASCGLRELRRITEPDFVPENHLISTEERIKSIEKLPDDNSERFFKHQVTVEKWNYCRTRAYGCAYEKLLNTEVRTMEHQFIDGVCACGYVQEVIHSREEFYKDVNWELVYYVEHIVKDDKQFSSAIGNLFNRGVDEVMGYLWNIANFDLFGLVGHIWEDMTYAYREEAAMNIIESLVGNGYSNKDLEETFLLISSAIHLGVDISDKTFDGLEKVLKSWDPDGIEIETQSVLKKIGIMNSVNKIIGNVIGSATLNANQKGTLQLLLSDYDENYAFLLMERRSAEINNDDELYEIYDIAMEKLEGEYERRAKAYIDNPVDYLSFDVFISGVELGLKLKNKNPIEIGLQKLAAKPSANGKLSKGANILLLVHTCVSWIGGEALGGNDIYDAQQKMYDNLTVLDPMQKQLLRRKEEYINNPTDTNMNLLAKEAVAVASYKQKTLDNVWQYRDAQWFTSVSESSINQEKNNLTIYSEGVAEINNGNTYSPEKAVPANDGANHSSDVCPVCALK